MKSGPIDIAVFLFSLSETNKRREDAASRSNESVEVPPPDLSEGAQMVANRLRKNQKKLANWLHKEAVECYRIYDADMPEYSVAIDVYGEHVHVAEYAPPKTVKEDDANRRLEEILDAVQIGCGCVFREPRPHIFQCQMPFLQVRP